MELLARYLADSGFVEDPYLHPELEPQVVDAGRAAAVRSGAAAGRPRLRRARARTLRRRMTRADR